MGFQLLCAGVDGDRFGAVVWDGWFIELGLLQGYGLSRVASLDEDEFYRAHLISIKPLQLAVSPLI
jgi:hypothetical protein